MSYLQDLESLKSVINSIPEDQIKVPAMPIDTYLMEAEALEHWAADDRALLIATGLSEPLFDSLPVCINACRAAQAQWTRERKLQHDIQVLWKEKAPQGYELHDHLIRAFRYGFRQHPALLEVVADIAEGDTHADMIQDLVTLAVLGRDNTTLLEAINFDLTLLEKADSLASELGDLLAQANGDRRNGNEGKILRDRAYTHLKKVVDEVRECGKYVFWDNPRRLLGYYSEFYKKKNTKSGKKEEVEITEE